MLKKKLTNTDLEISAICLGTDDFGTAVEERRAFEVMDYYYENGGNLIDTARIYAAWFENGEGMSEKTIGRWLKERKNRHDIIISSKCACPKLDKMHISRLTAKEMEDDIDKSLLALGVDCIDIMWLHRDDESKPVSEIMDAVNYISKKGKVRYFGASNWRASRIKEANKYAKAASTEHFIASQIKWSYAKTSPNYNDDPTLVEMDNTQMKFYKKSKLPVFAYASQAKGFFSKYEVGGEFALSKKAKERYLYYENVLRFKKAKRLADELSVPISAVILSYITSQKDIQAYAIVGCKNLQQISNSIMYSDLILTKEMLNYLDI